MEKQLAWQQNGHSEEQEAIELLQAWHPKSPKYQDMERVRDFNQLPDRKQRHDAYLRTLFKRWMRNAEDPEHWINFLNLPSMILFALHRPLMSPSDFVRELKYFDLYEDFNRIDYLEQDRLRKPRDLLLGIDVTGTDHVSSRYRNCLPKGMAHRERLNSELNHSKPADDEQVAENNFQREPIGLGMSLPSMPDYKGFQDHDSPSEEMFDDYEIFDNEMLRSKISEVVDLYRSNYIDTGEAAEQIHEAMGLLGYVPELEDLQTMLDDHEYAPKWIIDTILEDAVFSPTLSQGESDSGTTTRKKVTLNTSLKSQLMAIYHDRVCDNSSLADAIPKFRQALGQTEMTDYAVLMALKQHKIPDVILGDDERAISSLLGPDAVIKSIECASIPGQYVSMDLMGEEAELPCHFEYVEDMRATTVNPIDVETDLLQPPEGVHSTGIGLLPQAGKDVQTLLSPNTTKALENDAQSTTNESSDSSWKTSTSRKNSVSYPSSAASSPPSEQELSGDMQIPTQLSFSDNSVWRRSSSSPEDGETEDLWGIRMPTNQAKSLVSRLFQTRIETLEVELRRIRSITPQRKMEKQARSITSEVILPRAKRKFSSGPDSLRKYSRQANDDGLFAEIDEDHESFLGRCVHPIKIDKTKKRCLGCGHRLCRCEYSKLDASPIATLEHSPKIEQLSLENPVHVSPPPSDQTCSRYFDVVLLDSVDSGGRSPEKGSSGANLLPSSTEMPAIPKPVEYMVSPQCNGTVTLPGINSILQGIDTSGRKLQTSTAKASVPPLRLNRPTESQQPTLETSEDSTSHPSSSNVQSELYLAESTLLKPSSRKCQSTLQLVDIVAAVEATSSPKAKREPPEEALIPPNGTAPGGNPHHKSLLSPTSQQESWRTRYREVLRKMDVIIRRAQRERTRHPSPARTKTIPNIFEEARKLRLNFYVYLYMKQNIRERTNESCQSSYFAQNQAASKSGPSSALHKQFDKYRGILTPSLHIIIPAR